MKIIKKYIKYFYDFNKCQQGSTLIIVGLSIMAILGSAGLAIDISRINLASARLSKSLDAAGLAAGSTISTTNLSTEARKYLDLNFQNFMGAEITEFSAVLNAEGVIELSASATLDTSIVRIFDIDSATVSATAEITRAINGLELVMVLDNTGSMSGSKLTSLKSAATDMINILYSENESVDDLWIGLVPFSQSVNVGTSHASWMDTTYMNSKNWGPSSWGGCVDARLSGRDTTDDPPSVELLKSYYWPDNYYNNWIWYYYGSPQYYTPFSVYRGPNKYCSQEVTPMTGNKSTIIGAIDDMTAVGYTHINFGAVWGWRMLSPRWQTLWGGEMNTNSLPLDYNTPKMNKAAIVMTDGSNTMSSTIHSAYGYLSEGILGSTSSYWAAQELNSRLATTCTNMKANNIIVYTISFGSINTTSQNMMRNCATQSDYYFPSPSASELQQAFKAIGDSLSNLRVSK